MRRIVTWLVFAAALAALGYFIHAGTPPLPRWRLRRRPWPITASSA